MPLTEDQRRYLETELDKCDAALADKPNLALVYDEAWRTGFRQAVLSVDSMNDVGWPRAYGLPHLDGHFYPADLQDRLEQGAAVLLPKLSDADRNHLIQRLRGNGSLSAEEELLLARGFADQFGPESIHGPQGPRSTQRPEFTVEINAHEIDIEAKGLLDSARVSELSRAAIQSGQYAWFTWDDGTSDRSRLRAAVARKICAIAPNRPTVLVLTQYTAWPTADEAIDILRSIALAPDQFNLDADRHPLAVAYVFEHLVQSVWINSNVAASHSITQRMCERIRDAARSAFYARADGIFFHDRLDEQEHRCMVMRMLSRGVDPSSNASQRG